MKNKYVLLLCVLILILSGCGTGEDDPFNIPSSFSPLYTIVSGKDLSYGAVQRREVRIKVPTGLSEEQLALNIRHVFKVVYDKYKPKAIAVFAYKEGDKAEGLFTAGKGEFAPYGDWARADENVSLSNYKCVIEASETYMRPVKIDSAEVKVVDKAVKTLSNSVLISENNIEMTTVPTGYYFEYAETKGNLVGVVSPAGEYRYFLKDQVAIVTDYKVSLSGVSEAVQKEVFGKLSECEATATEEAIAKYPEDVEAQIDYERIISDKLKLELGQEYGLNCIQLEWLVVNGFKAGWQ